MPKSGPGPSRRLRSSEFFGRYTPNDLALRLPFLVRLSPRPITSGDAREIATSAVTTDAVRVPTSENACDSATSAASTVATSFMVPVDGTGCNLECRMRRLRKRRRRGSASRAPNKNYSRMGPIFLGAKRSRAVSRYRPLMV